MNRKVWKVYCLLLTTRSLCQPSLGLSLRTASLFYRSITRNCHWGTRLFRSLLCWWYSTLPLILAWWSDDSYSYLNMSERHCILAEGFAFSPSTQPCRDRIACGFRQHNTSSVTPETLESSVELCRFAWYNIITFLSEIAALLLYLLGPFACKKKKKKRNRSWKIKIRACLISK